MPRVAWWSRCEARSRSVARGDNLALCMSPSATRSRAARDGRGAPTNGEGEKRVWETVESSGERWVKGMDAAAPRTPGAGRGSKRTARTATTPPGTKR
eukprot:scaffold3348_cov113-Isochrysis_galbana.AAC.15